MAVEAKTCCVNVVPWEMRPKFVDVVSHDSENQNFRVQSPVAQLKPKVIEFFPPC